MRDFSLSDQGSNLDKQNQNLLCYHYTIGQSGCKNTSAVLFSEADGGFFLINYLRQNKSFEIKGLKHFKN